MLEYVICICSFYTLKILSHTHLVLAAFSQKFWECFNYIPTSSKGRNVNTEGPQLLVKSNETASVDINLALLVDKDTPCIVQ